MKSAAPRIVVYQTKTAGTQVRYVAASGRVSIQQRRLTFAEAMARGAAAARIHRVALEVEP